METILIGYAIIAVFCAGRFTGKYYEEYIWNQFVRFVGGWIWPLLLLAYAFLFLEEWIPLAWRGNFANSIRVLLLGRNLWQNHHVLKIQKAIQQPLNFEKNKVWGWLYRKAYARLVAMNKDRVEFCES